MLTFCRVETRPTVIFNKRQLFTILYLSVNSNGRLQWAKNRHHLK